MGRLRKVLARLMGHIPVGHDFYSGEYYGGKADFVYIPAGKTRIMDGKFSFHLKMGGGMYRKAKGEFENDKKTGVWFFIRSGSNSLTQVEATFKEGELCGPLIFVRKEEIIGGTLCHSLELNIIDGKIVGCIHGHYGINSIEGYCDENGCANEQWSMIAKENDEVITTKKEVYDHGKFISAYEQESGRSSKPANPTILRKINYYLSDDVQHILRTIPYGSLNQVPQIKVDNS